MKFFPVDIKEKGSLFLFLIILIVSQPIFSQPLSLNSDSVAYSYTKFSDRINKTTLIRYKGDSLLFKSPKLFSVIKNVPSDLLYIVKSPFKREAIPWLAAVAVSTGISIAYDQKITDWIKRTSYKHCISANTSYNVLIKAGNTKVLQVPRNGTTAFYQLGQGGTSLLLAGGMWVYGKFYHDYRAVSTAADLTETFITMAIVTQVIKRITGRESPFEATAPGGRWRPFPSFSAFQKDTPKYDAFPSGHLATLMATITVLSENYPEKKWIRPVGYSLMGICMWTMANIEVHWVGDYPLALAIGYLSGKITSMQHRKKDKPAAMLF
ncbi:MAG: phosphatase PAP2 family protein [Bacteroidetes bacterium]|nr:phosphatase PAP2 family protein [Bacteroidota bacterium]